LQTSVILCKHKTSVTGFVRAWSVQIFRYISFVRSCIYSLKREQKIWVYWLVLSLVFWRC